MNGPVRSYKLGVPMDWQAFIAMPEEYQKLYLQMLGKNYGVSIDNLVALFHINIKVLYKHLQEHNLAKALDDGRRDGNVKFNSSTWNKFCYGDDKDDAADNDATTAGKDAEETTKATDDFSEATDGTEDAPALPKREIIAGLNHIAEVSDISASRMATLTGVTQSIYFNYIHNRAVAPIRAYTIVKNYLVMRSLSSKEIVEMSSVRKDAATAYAEMLAKKKKKQAETPKSIIEKPLQRFSKEKEARQAKLNERQFFIQAIDDMCKRLNIHFGDVGSILGVDFQSIVDYVNGREVSKRMERKIVEGLKQLDGTVKEDATAFIYHLHPVPNVKQPIPDRIIQPAAQKPAAEVPDTSEKTEPATAQTPAPAGQSMELPLSGNLETVISALTAIYGKEPNKVITIKVQL